MSANCAPAQLQSLTQFGYHVGLAFQIIDDILDVTQTSENLGKTAGKDITARKATYPSIVGLEASRKIAARLTARAFAALEPFGGKAKALRSWRNTFCNGTGSGPDVTRRRVRCLPLIQSHRG